MRKVLLAFLIVVLLGTAGLAVLLRKLQQWEVAEQAIRPDIQVTIPEGWRREEIAARLEESKVCSASEFLAATTDKEGYLFPDTYRFFENTPAAEVVNEMLANFNKKMGNLKPTQEQLILASIVEREGKTDEDRFLIAGVYSNRLKINMKLDADPTVQYAKDNQNFAAADNSPTFTFWKPITQADYSRVKSPYNTYLQPGLPPGPIANPGQKSILAALSPAQHDYFYFLYRGGELKLSKTLSEHQSKE